MKFDFKKIFILLMMLVYVNKGFIYRLRHKTYSTYIYNWMH